MTELNTDMKKFLLDEFEWTNKKLGSIIATIGELERRQMKTIADLREMIDIEEAKSA